MLSTTPVRDEDRLTPPMRRYLRWLVVSMSMYVILLVTSLFALRAVPAEATALRVLFGLMPVLPLLVVVWAYVRYVRDADELQRLIELQAQSWASAAVGIGFLVAGFLASADVITLRGELVAILVLPAICGAYGIAKLFVHRKFER